MIEGHYFLLESSDANSRYVEMNRTTDYLLNNLKENHTLLNEISKKMFGYFEKRSLFKAAAYLSDKLLNDVDCACELDESLEKKLQKYGALKIGATAPDIQLNATRKLSDLNQNVLLVFGSSQCPHCTKELPDLEQLYRNQISNKVTVVYVSLDTDKTEFESQYKTKPWETFCDFKGWDTQAAKDYYVNATPTYILLDKNLKILLHPKSVAHASAWAKGRF